MKAITLASFIFLTAISAWATNPARISCVSEEKFGLQLTLNADTLQEFGNEKWRLVNVNAILFQNGDKEGIGQAEYLDSDQGYYPTKYKNHMRFDLTKLTDTVTHGSFAPGTEEYEMYVLLPHNILELKSKVVPLQIKGEQGGGLLNLTCTLTKN